MKFVALTLAALAASTAAASAQEGGRVWMVKAPKEADATLVFAQPDTDDQPLSMSCVRKSGQVNFAVALSRSVGVRSDAQGVWYDKAGLRAPWPSSVTLKSLESASTLRGQTHADEVSGGSMVLGEISTRAPVIAAFRKSGQLSVTSLGETVTLPPAKTALVRKFLGACK